MGVRFSQVFPAPVIIVLLLVSPLAAAPAPATQPSLRPGDALPAAFEPVNVTGEFAGRRHCLVCENGLSPVVMVFARRTSAPLEAMMTKVDAAIAKDATRQLGGFAVFLSDDEKLEEQLTDVAAKAELKQFVLSIESPAGPDGYNIPADAEVVVVLYTNHVVKASHTFAKGELTDKAVEKVMADVPLILPPPAK